MNNSNSIQERLQLKREPFDKWSLREKLCLASAVARSGDQNWMSVSRALKPFMEPNRPADWFHQKNCAAQYGALLNDVETPKRKKRTGNGDSVVETPAESIFKKLLVERQAEIKKLLMEEKAEYKKLQDDMKMLQTGHVSEEQLNKWCKEIDEEEFKREQDAANHAKWLKQRDLKKQEIERAFRLLNKTQTTFPGIGQKRKLSDATDESADKEATDQQQYQEFVSTTPPQQKSYFEIQTQQTLNIPQQESVKPALSPLLTSLLKSPSQVQNITPVSSSILHSVITNQNTTSKIVENSPAITSLLNITPNLPILQQEIPEANNLTSDDSNQPLDLLDDANIKIDDLAKSILEENSPFPEIKKEEVDDIISEIIENAHDIVADPEQHLELDKNGDININLEIDDLEPSIVNEPEAEIVIKEDIKNEVKTSEEKPTPAPIIDPFEFQEDPILFDSPVKPSTLKQEYVPLYQQSPIKTEEAKKDETEKVVHGSVEIVEVSPEDQRNEKELNKEEICDIVHSAEENKELIKEQTEEIPNPEIKIEETLVANSDQEIIETKKSEDSPQYSEPKENQDSSDTNINLSQNDGILSFSDDLYDDNINMEVKIDKTGRTKRDYSRPKKKEDKTFDLLLAMEKANFDQPDDSKPEGQKRSIHTRLKSDSERSFSPWTEDEDSHSKPPKSETPVDSFPNSPASSTAFYEDDKEYRNWKKSVMLVYNRLASNKYASLFLKPITNEQAPGYSSVVYRPMDLQTIKKNIDNGTIRNSLEFKRDVMLMFTNAIMYNKTNDTIFNMALQMQQESMNPIEILLQAEGQVETPVRRETRTSESGSKRKRILDESGKRKRKEDY